LTQLFDRNPQRLGQERFSINPATKHAGTF
jgi:hypothetical protein